MKSLSLYFRSVYIFTSALFLVMYLSGAMMAQTGTIQGFAFIDLNGNGIMDGNNGYNDYFPSWATINLNGPVSASVLPDIYCNYKFSNLPAGTYTVTARDSEGLCMIIPATGQHGMHVITLADGETSTGNDFAWFGLGDVWGILYEDVNSDGVRDISEPGLNEWTLRLTDTTSSSKWTESYFVTLHVRNGTLKQKMDFGIHPLATYGIDKMLGEFTFWYPVTNELARFVEIPSHIGEVGTGTYQDYRPSVSTSQIDTFKIVYKVDPLQGTELEFSWPSGLDEVLESCQLLNSLESPSISVNMLAATTTTVTTTDVDSLYIIAQRKSTWTGGYRYSITGTNYIFAGQWLPHPDGYLEFRDLLPGSYTLSLFTKGGWQDQEVTPGNYNIPVILSGTSLNYNIAARNTGTKSWKLISVPHLHVDMNKETLYPTAISNAFTYDGKYVSQNILENGKGFWLKFPKPEAPTIMSGNSLPNIDLPVAEGWNLIGSISSPILTTSITSTPSGMTTSEFFTYSGTYEKATTITPGMGYWVKVNEDGLLHLSVSSKQNPNARIRIIPDIQTPPPAPDESTVSHVIPAQFILDQNYPNPFNPTTKIRFTIIDSRFTTLKVYDVLGRVVATLVDEVKQPGEYSVEWDASASGGLPSGVYYYRLQSGNFAETKKLILMK